MTDSTGNVTVSYTYDSYGNLIDSTGTSDNTYGFTGEQQFEEADNLVFLRARYYNTSIGRFISRDPIGYEDNLNLYMYVSNNPVNFVDPSGEGIWGCIKALVRMHRACSKDDLAKAKKKADELEEEWYRRCEELKVGGRMPSYPSHMRAKVLSSKEFKDFVKSLKKCGRAILNAQRACGWFPFL